MNKRSNLFGLVGILACIVFLSGCEFDFPNPFPDPPSIISVPCNTQDLVDAINEANADPNHSLIILETDCSYPLTGVNNTELEGASGLPVISTSITIEGNNAYIWRDYGATTSKFRILSVNSNGNLALNDLTLAYGNLYAPGSIDGGGAIFVLDGELTLNQTHLEYNEAHAGGGIFNRGGAVILKNSSLVSNQANIGGGINVTEGDLTIQHSELNYNQASGSGGGLSFYSTSSPLVIERGTFVENTAGSFGGGVYISAGTFEISNSGFTRNYSDGSGGGFATKANGTINDFSLFLENTAINGGGIGAHYPSVVTIENTVFLRNEASSVGGGIESRDNLTLINSTVYDNQAEFGGGIDTTGPLTVIGSTIRENTAIEQGGGIYAAMDASGHSSVDLLNTTISGNQAISGAGMVVGWSGKIAFSTIAYNIGTYSGGIWARGDLDITNAIVAENHPNDCDTGSQGSYNAIGENLSTDGLCTGFTLINYPWLGPLADNGGSTYTHALGAFSPALDAAADCTDTDGNSVGADQRGEPRPYGSACDLGAYEAQSDPRPHAYFDIPIIFRQNVNCRIGPHEKHIVVLTFLAEDAAQAIGRNKDGSWLAALIPEEEGEFDTMWCWVPDRFLDYHLDKFELPELDHLPSPDRLEPKEPTKEPGESDSGCGASGCP